MRNINFNAAKKQLSFIEGEFDYNGVEFVYSHDTKICVYNIETFTLSSDKLWEISQPDDINE